MAVKEFFQNAFKDMKESAKAQHEVDKAEFAAVKAESKAQWEEAKEKGNPEILKAKMQAERDKKQPPQMIACQKRKPVLVQRKTTDNTT